MKRGLLAFLNILIIGVIFSFSIKDFSLSAAHNNQFLEEIIEGIINWKKSDVGATSNEYLINSEFLELAGSTPGDWYPMALGRYGFSDNYNAYLAVIEENVTTRYKSKGKLHSAKATEWHRISLAITAAGGNPLAIGEYEGSRINLIADGTYNRGLVASPGRQGINGWIWGLITLDSKRYEVPEDAFNTRIDFILEILNKQLQDGGWALSGNISDPDITAMAIQALSPYYNSENIYSYKSTQIKDEDGNYIVFEKSVRTAVDEAVEWLASVQTDDGDFFSWGTQNVESTVWTMLALISIGINPLDDSRFITSSGKTLLDGILKYRNHDGGFIHSYTYDKDNPTSLPDKSNTMASEQTLYGLIALWRYNNEMRNFFDMRNEFTLEEKNQISEVKNLISNLNSDSDKDSVLLALNKYLNLSNHDRCYIRNYGKLRDFAIKFDVELPLDDSLFIGGQDGGSNGEDVILHFSETNKEEAKAIINLDDFTTEYYVDVVRLLYILEHSEDFQDKQKYVIGLEKAYNAIVDIQKEIAQINDLVRQKLYPFEEISLRDRTIVNSIFDRILNLSEYDKKHILSYDDILKTKTQVDNLYTALIVGIILSIVAILASYFLVYDIKKRRRLKRLAKEVIVEDKK